MLRFKTSISSTPTISLFGLFIVYKYNTRFVSVEETKEGVRLTRRRGEEEGKKRGGGGGGKSSCVVIVVSYSNNKAKIIIINKIKTKLNKNKVVVILSNCKSLIVFGIGSDSSYLLFHSQQNIIYYI